MLVMQNFIKVMLIMQNIYKVMLIMQYLNLNYVGYAQFN